MTAGLDLDPAEFLRDYWQRKPLLTALLGDFENPLSAEELAGLAMESDVESRIVRGVEDSMRIEHGPFQADAFDGNEPWSLLVQRVDHHVPAVTKLRRLVDFLPGWQLDDIMVSYAVDGGGVGPHYDNYDVFLLQAAGHRLWRLGQYCDGDEPQRDIAGHRILENFQPSTEHLLAPGEVLYVPPRLAHWGIASGPSMTISIGFRAPRVNDLLSRWTDAALPLVDPEQLHRDGLAAGAPGEITPESLALAGRCIQELAAGLDPGADWFGELVTEAGDLPGQLPDAALPRRVEADPASRLAWYRLEAGIAVYANGERVDAAEGTAPLLEKLCRGETIAVPGDAAASGLLEALWQRGCLLDGG